MFDATQSKLNDANMKIHICLLKRKIFELCELICGSHGFCATPLCVQIELIWSAITDMHPGRIGVHLLCQVGMGVDLSVVREAPYFVNYVAFSKASDQSEDLLSIASCSSRHTVDSNLTCLQGVQSRSILHTRTAASDVIVYMHRECMFGKAC